MSSTMSNTTTTTLTWDEPAGAASPRGWCYPEHGGAPVGWYLDYGSGHRDRDTHVQTPYVDGREVSYCTAVRPCVECQPGNVLVSAYPGGPGTPAVSRWVETVEVARWYVEAAYRRDVRVVRVVTAPITRRVVRMASAERDRWWQRLAVADAYKTAVGRGHSYPIGAVR